MSEEPTDKKRKTTPPMAARKPRRKTETETVMVMVRMLLLKTGKTGKTALPNPKRAKTAKSPKKAAKRNSSSLPLPWWCCWAVVEVLRFS